MTRGILNVAFLCRAARFCVLLLMLAAAGCGPSQVESTVRLSSAISWDSLLTDAQNTSTLAKPLSPPSKAKLFSSAADASKVMLAHRALELIGDMDYGFFTAVATNQDGVDATLAEVSGAGVVTWVWSANPVGTLRLYVDQMETPALSMPFAEFLKGGFLPTREPFGTVTSLGYNLHFPIIHAKCCKLVLHVPRLNDLAQLYYQVAWQSLPPEAEIQPFDVAAIKRASATVKQIGKRLVAVSRSTEPAANLAPPQRVECSLEPGKTLEVFRANGPQAIVSLRFTARAKSDLEGLWLEGNWDGQAALQAPLHMLAGVSSAMEDTQSLPATVDGARVLLRWFMPFASAGQIRCTNSTDHSCRLTVEVWTQPILASHYPLHFNANFQRIEKLRPEAGNLLTFADTAGPGRFAGCVLDVDSRSDQWWGEGDNIVWLDDTNVPAVHGTGTEDYFGFAWCSPAAFNHPFRGQTRADKSRDHWISTMHRYHLLDQLPFLQWGRFQFQALGLGRGEMDWMATAMWYATPSGGT
jgi:hypothetical protein